MNQLKTLIKKCNESESSLFFAIIFYLFYKLFGKSIVRNKFVILNGLKNIITDGVLQIGISKVGFMHKFDRTYLNVNGKLIFKGQYSIAKGCRFDIGHGAIAEFGNGAVNANSMFVIMHGLKVGSNCSISWDCQFLDEDFHEIFYEGRKKKDNKITIGDNVWIGSKVIILKGAVIPDGCIIASGSVVTKAFTQKNVLIAGNPAKIIKERVKWIE